METSVNAICSQITNSAPPVPVNNQEEEQLNNLFALALSKRAAQPVQSDDDDFTMPIYAPEPEPAPEQQQIMNVFSKILNNKKPTSSTAHLVNLAPKRECVGCGEYNIPGTSPDYVVRCRTCYQDRKSKMRACCDCKQNNIPDDSAAYVVRCRQCYMKHRTATTAAKDA